MVGWAALGVMGGLEDNLCSSEPVVEELTVTVKECPYKPGKKIDEAWPG